MQNLHCREDVIAQMLAESGHLMTGERLWRTLGFKSAAAFRQAKMRNQVGVRTFSIAHRRGSYAYTTEVAEWLYAVGRESEMRR